VRACVHACAIARERGREGGRRGESERRREEGRDGRDTLEIRHRITNGLRGLEPYFSHAVAEEAGSSHHADIYCRFRSAQEIAGSDGIL
jgi:hypothetical protein